MIIADTSIWIEFFRGNQKVFSPMKELLENREVYALECVFGELLQGAKNKRETNIILEYWKNTPHIDIADIWIKAGLLTAEKKLLSQGVGLIDAVIMVAAERTESKVWTLDKNLLRVIPKKKSWRL